MDPLSIAASVVALGEAVRHIFHLVAKVRSHIKFTEEIDSLIANVELLSHALDAASSSLSSMPPVSASRVFPIINESRQILNEIESLVSKYDEAIHKDIGNPSIRIRIFWLKRTSKVQRLKERLSEVLFGILFFFTLSGRQSFVDTSLPQNEGHQLLAFIRHPSPTPTHLKRELISPLAYSYNNLNSVGIRKKLGYSDRHSFRDVAFRNQSPMNVPSPVTASRRCQPSCQCSCHHQVSGTIQLAKGSLGYLLFNHKGNVFRNRLCDSTSCAGNTFSEFSMVYYGPRLVSNAAFAFRLISSRGLSISLSFPRILPPDHEFFQAIRQGDCKRMRELLTTGQASPADIALPHGLTALDLAMFYGQWEASELLISEGAPQFVPPNNHWIVQDVWDYFAGCSLISTTVSAFTVTYDGLCIIAPGWHIGTLRSYASTGRLEALNFSRVHKCITGLSSESLDNIDELRAKVNEIDSFGRTALYWAATLGLQDALEKLLLNGANPNQADFNGSAPLHKAASIGSVSAITLLLSSGAELEDRDRNGCSPLFYASSQGHIDAIVALLENGADFGSTSYLGESPIHFANHAIRPEVVQFLRERGASLDPQDAWGFNAVLDAVFEDSHEALRYLITQECTRDACLFDGKNIFHIAALNSNLQTIEILLEADLTGIDPYALDNAGFTPLEYLRKRPNAQDLLEPFCALALRATKNGAEPDYAVESGEEEFFDAAEHLNT